MRTSIRRSNRRYPTTAGPLPAVVSKAGPWAADEPSPGFGGAVSVKDRRFYGPTGNSKSAIAIRAHEYGHKANHRMGLPDDIIGKGMSYGITWDWMQAVNDVVDNWYLWNSLGIKDIAHLPLEFPPMGPANSLKDIPVTSWYPWIQWYMRSLNLEACREQREHLFDNLGDGIDATYTVSFAEDKLREFAMRLDYSDYMEMVTYAALLQNAYGPHPVAIDVVNPGGPGPIMGGFGVLVAESNVWWGKMRIINPPLESTRELRKLARTTRKSYCGAFRYPLRALAPAFDGSCFSLNRRVHGASVLIDLSGSMQISSAMLTDLLKTAPASVVAGYASEASGDTYSGVLGIIAQSGRVCPEARGYFGSGNVVDGPALDWLAAQPEPRIWICDGQVTGVGDNPSPMLMAIANAKQRAGNITRIATVPKAIEYLNGIFKPSRR